MGTLLLAGVIAMSIFGALGVLVFGMIFGWVLRGASLREKKIEMVAHDLLQAVKLGIARARVAEERAGASEEVTAEMGDRLVEWASEDLPGDAVGQCGQ